jgi:hypothetical protein
MYAGAEIMRIAPERVVLIPGAFVGVLIREVGNLPRVRLLMVTRPRPAGAPPARVANVAAPFFPVARKIAPRRPG